MKELRQLKESLEDGIYYAQIYLQAHLNEYGRSTIKNNQIATGIEEDIERMKLCLKRVEKQIAEQATLNQ